MGDSNLLIFPKKELVKTTYQDDYSSILDTVGGLGGMNTFLDSSRLVKSASRGLFTPDEFAQAKAMVPKHWYGIHKVAMGAEETYGWNRNADGWTEDELIVSHPTFVSDAKAFKEHRNRPGDTVIGKVAFAKFHPEMKRVEILAMYDPEKDPALYEKVKQQKEASFSMSCRLPADVCNCCGNHAPSPRDYCQYMKKRATQWIPELKKYAFVRNPKSRFFDISHVERPADRIAHYLDYILAEDGSMSKAASERGNVILGAEWAEYEFGKNAFQTIGDLMSEREENILRQLAGDESIIDDIRAGRPTRIHLSKRAFVEEMCLHRSPEILEVEKFGNAQPASLFGALANTGVIIPATEFFNLILGSENTDNPVVKEACASASLSLRVLEAEKEKSASDALYSTMQVIAPAADDVSPVTPEADDAIAALMKSAEKNFSCRAEPAFYRACEAVGKDWTKKASADVSLDQLSEGAKTLLTLYGWYKVKTAHVMMSGAPELDEREKLLIASAY